MTDNPNPVPPKPLKMERGLSEFYTPAPLDSIMIIRFIGNTARIADMQMGGVDPFQMIAAAEYLKMKSFQMIQTAEIEEAAKVRAEEETNQIITTGKLPPEGFVTPGDALKG